MRHQAQWQCLPQMRMKIASLLAMLRGYFRRNANEQWRTLANIGMTKTLKIAIHTRNGEL
jgi:hypothetical protein